MSKSKPVTRTEAAEPPATRHLNAYQKKALDVQADAEHSDGKEREHLTRKMTVLGSSRKPIAD